ncbi:MAG: RHS repeat-associated core domain-containing protein, partial [Defluviitaleaceae bacterium]|nr:RHS repeat-associated core domain-containing protein [Defluviitaleaceae bacterium]
MGRVEYDYDSMGNLIRENRAGVVTTFTYNAMNQLVSRTAPTGQYTYTYDRRGNLLAESRGGVPVRTFEFDALGRMIRGTNELGETSAYEYNALNLRVANVQHLLPGHEGGHGWDVNGYLNDEPNSPGSRYIDVNRQALAGLPAGVWLDALDGYEWDIEALRDIETVRNAEGGVPYSHQRIFKDNFGLNRNSGVVRQEFVIDYVMGFNQDLMVVEAGGWETVFVYGSPLQRISQHTTKTDSIISGVPMVGGAIDPHGNVAADIAVMPTYQVLYYRLDFRNSTSQMQLPNGQYIAWTGYDEWGVVTSPDSHDMNMAGVQDSIRFTSYTKDRVLGLYYAQNRWYDATTRRFTAVDPIKDGDNWYIYVGNNPVNWIDPDGLQQATVWINGQEINVNTRDGDTVLEMLHTFDPHARRTSTNRIQVYNYGTGRPRTIIYGPNVRVTQILSDAGFVRVTSILHPENPPPAFFRTITCNMYGGSAINRHEHLLGITEADILVSLLIRHMLIHVCC